MRGDIYRTWKRGRVILKLRRPLSFFSTEYELKPASVSSSALPFSFGALFMKKNNKNKIIMAFKILKQSITSTKADFSDYVSINFKFLVTYSPCTV